MTILLAIDDSKFSEAAVRAVAAQASRDMKVWVLHVLEPPSTLLGREMGGYEPEFEAVWKARREHAKALVAKVAERLRDSGLNATSILKEGDPKLRIIDLAKEWHADLIVLGSHGRKGLNRFLMGSVSEAVARHAPCSVQIVRIPTESTHLSVSPNEMRKDVGVPRGSSQIPTARESKRRKRVCNLCGKPSEDNICPTCADRIRAEAVARKKREDKGKE